MPYSTKEEKSIAAIIFQCHKFINIWLVKLKPNIFVIYVTSPFLKDSTLKKSLNYFMKRKKKFDSIATVSPLKEYLWRGKSDEL